MTNKKTIHNLLIRLRYIKEKTTSNKGGCYRKFFFKEKDFEVIIYVDINANKYYVETFGDVRSGEDTCVIVEAVKTLETDLQILGIKYNCTMLCRKEKRIYKEWLENGKQ